MNAPNPTWRQRWRAFTYALYLIRFNLLMLAAGAALLSVDQGRDVLIAMAEDAGSDPLGLLAFFGAVTFWGFSIWLWARAMLDTRSPDPPEHRRGFNLWRRHLPRGLGVLAFAATANALWQAEEGAPPPLRPTLTVLALVSLGLGALFWVVAWGGMRMSDPLADRYGEAFRARRVEPDDEPPYAGVGQALTGIRGTFLVLSMLIGTALFFGSWMFPVEVGTLLGALTLFLLWAATWLPIGSAITYLSTRTGIPFLGILLVGAVVFSLWNDNHEITHAADAQDPAQRPAVAEALGAWLRTQETTTAPPLVVVATAGGGIRAAYWTAAVLGEVQDRTATDAAYRPLDAQMFALSGVSGGSVGAALYRALLPTHAPGNPDPACPAGLRDCTARVLSQDLLGPAVANLMYPDLLQRFLPLPLMHPDRGRALEMSWEQALRTATGSDRLAGSLLGLYDRDARPWPALLLNATWVANGRRIVASNLRLDGPSFGLAADQLTELGRDLPLSTAAHNSARFPGVSPPGMWRQADEVVGRLVDGGYFENFGAETALDLLDAAERTLGGAFRPVVIAISSDPSLPADPAEIPDRNPLHWAYEVRSPLRAMFRTREARGAEAIERLKRWAEQRKGRGAVFAYFRMCAPGQGEFEPPLGWALSKAAREEIDGYLPRTGASSCPGNDEALAAVLAGLKR